MENSAQKEFTNSTADTEVCPLRAFLREVNNVLLLLSFALTNIRCSVRFNKISSGVSTALELNLRLNLNN